MAGSIWSIIIFLGWLGGDPVWSSGIIGEFSFGYLGSLGGVWLCSWAVGVDGCLAGTSAVWLVGMVCL